MHTMCVGCHIAAAIRHHTTQLSFPLLSITHTQLAEGSGAVEKGSRANAARMEHSDMWLASLDRVYAATAGLPLPAMVHVGSIPASRQTAAVALEEYGMALLVEATARPEINATCMSIARPKGLWGRPIHSRLHFEEIARLLILQVIPS